MRHTPKEIKALLRYDPLTGLLWWKNDSRLYRRKTTVPPGHKSFGYVRITVHPRAYPAHALAWVIMKGRWPKREIDHRDMNRANNKWENLRLATRGQNRQNCKPFKNNKSGLKGVMRQATRWRAEINASNKRYYLGLFGTKEEAYAAYCAAASKLHKEFARF